MAKILVVDDKVVLSLIFPGISKKCEAQEVLKQLGE